MEPISKGLDLDAQARIEGAKPETEPAKPAAEELPEGYEMFEGVPRKVLQPHRSGWWRFNEHYDRNGYCDNPARGY